MRLGACAPSHCPTMPPIESPHQLIPCDPERIENGEDVTAEPVHRVGALWHVGFPVAATVVTNQPKMPGERLHLLVPHMQVGAERIGQHQNRRLLRSFDFDVNACSRRL